MTFERTADYALLNTLVRNPSIFPFLGDDFRPSIDDAVVAENAELWYILARDEGGLLGFWMFEPRSTIVYEFHTAMLLDSRGLAAMRELLGPEGWLWKHTGCRRAVTYVPESNAIAYRFGIRAGLKLYGRNPESHLKNGKLEDQILLGIGEPKKE